MALVPCPSCRRHVRGEDASCPFCQGVLPRSLRAVPSSTTRLGRSALVAFATSVAACGGQVDVASDGGAVGDSATTSDAIGADDTGGAVAAYGAPSDTGFVEEDTGSAVDTGTAQDTGGTVAAYGGPFPDAAAFDTSTTKKDGGDGDATKDAAKDSAIDDGTVKDTGGPQPPYGLPPP